MRFLILLALLLALPASAQVGTDVFVQQAGVTLSPDVTGLELGSTPAEMLRGVLPASLATDENAVVIDQNGVRNAVSVSQIGTGNRLLLSQLGDGLSATIQQDGNSNEAALSMDGDQNQVLHIQRGDRNQYTLSLNVSGTEHAVTQIGNDLQATQIVAPGMLPASIEQRGQSTAVVVVRQ